MTRPTYTLPRRKRFNWPCGRWRNVKYRVIVWIAVAAIIGLVYAGLEHTFEQSARLQAEAAHKALIADVRRYDVMGAPGSTWTDWKEGTRKWKR